MKPRTLVELFLLQTLRRTNNTFDETVVQASQRELFLHQIVITTPCAVPVTQERATYWIGLALGFLFCDADKGARSVVAQMHLGQSEGCQSQECHKLTSDSEGRYQHCHMCVGGRPQDVTIEEMCPGGCTTSHSDLSGILSGSDLKHRRSFQ